MSGRIICRSSHFFFLRAGERRSAHPAIIPYSTPAAWGHLQSTEDRGLGIAISNFELGVILPIRGGTMNEVEEKASALASYRRPLVPVCDFSLFFFS